VYSKIYALNEEGTYLFPLTLRFLFTLWLYFIGVSLSEPHTSEILENIPYLVVRTFDMQYHGFRTLARV